MRRASIGTNILADASYVIVLYDKIHQSAVVHGKSRPAGRVVADRTQYCRGIKPRDVAYIILGAMAFCAVILTILSPVSYDHVSLDPVWAASAMLVGTGRFLGRGRYKAFGLILEGLGCYFFVSLLGAYLSVVICTFVTNLVDTDLVRADALLGFAWDTSVLGWSDHRGIFVVLSMAYSTLAWQPVVLMGVIVTRTAPECLWNFLAAWSLALAVTLLCFPFFPAVGNMTARGIGREDLPHAMVSSGWTYGEHILAIRKGLVQSIGRGELDGLVTFPSFHAAGAVILMAGWCQAQRIGIPFVILNFIMIVSALAIGGHYLVDVLAGIVLALACVAGVFYMPSVRTASPPPARQ